MSTPNYPTERRQAKRLLVEVEAELSADLALLDASQRNVTGNSLLLLGLTRDISASGLALVIPAIRIDESYLSHSQKMPLALQLEGSKVNFEIEPVHCLPIVRQDPNQGYIIGARIVDFYENSAYWQHYLHSLTF